MGCPRGAIIRVVDCEIVVNKFELQLRYYVHFRTNTTEKGKKLPYPFTYGLNCTNTRPLQGWLWH